MVSEISKRLMQMIRVTRVMLKSEVKHPKKRMMMITMKKAMVCLNRKNKSVMEATMKIVQMPNKRLSR